MSSQLNAATTLVGKFRQIVAILRSDSREVKLALAGLLLLAAAKLVLLADRIRFWTPGLAARNFGFLLISSIVGIMDSAQIPLALQHLHR